MKTVIVSALLVILALGFGVIVPLIGAHAEIRQHDRREHEAALNDEREAASRERALVRTGR